MTTTRLAIGFTCIGLVLVLMSLVSLWRGEVGTGRKSLAHRGSEPVRFFATVFFRLLLAALFISTGVFLWQHPHFSLAPKPDPHLIKWNPPMGTGRGAVR